MGTATTETRHLKERVEEFARSGEGSRRETAMPVFLAFRDALERGEIRAATRGDDGRWTTHEWVKRGILLGFRIGRMQDYSSHPFPFFDKDTYPVGRREVDEGIRIVPGGTAIRSGAHLAKGVVLMPPAYVNVGAFVGEGTMVDSHALVGSCAQVGARVHLSAAAQIGGVLEPVNALPVIVEDDVFVGGGCGVYEGCVVRTGVVLAPGVILSRSTRVYDLVKESVLAATADRPLEVPAGAVVVPGSRQATSSFAHKHGIGLYAPVIVKYRDASTDAATTLEQALRDI